MRILLIAPGKLKTVPMSIFAHKALLRLGHEVIYQCYNDSLWEKVITIIYKVLGRKEIYAGANIRIRNTLLTFRPQLLFTIYGIHISSETLTFAKKLQTKTACWWLNDPFQFERGFKFAVNYDYWFSNSAECAKKINSKLGVKSFFLPTACDPKTHEKTSRDVKLICDVCFAGDWSQSREDLMLFLLSKGINIKIYGPWEKKLNKNSSLLPYLTPGFFKPEEMSRYFSNAKIVLNQHTWFKKASHGVNPRLFEAALCGAAQIVDYKNEMPQLFDLDSEILTYKNIKEVPIIINFLLKNEKRREKIANNCRMKALTKHTYMHRMKEMLSYINFQTK
jgi:spore maturation protein CgeB